MAAQAPPPPPPEQKMMVAIDESECSHYALEWALRNLAPRRLILFTVQPFSPLSYLPAGSPRAVGPSVASPELIRSVTEHQRQLAQALVDKAKAICAEHGVEAETAIEVGDPKETICEAAEKLNVDLLILGSHSRGPIQRFFLGSVSNYCSHHAKCPVLVVKKKE
ncbi:universal stress protein A-like protein isoform X1 [Triticum dicoccoides]|uniref:universal stress protein A-like protein isoform X1 n=1 Tax=Triticum dicoccoides TaxID=85692 RepID=UPI00162EA616|nr:universal stress protein A-like protein isoform X1 [Triticum dicoccoides]